MRATRVGAGAESSAKCPGRAVTVPMALTTCGKDCFVATAVPTPPTVCSEGGVSAAALAWRSPRQAVSIRAAATSDALAFMADPWRSEEHTSELQSRLHLVCRLLLE